MNQWTKFFIIAACSFAFVFLCLLLFLYLQCKHPRKNKKGSDSNSNSKHPSPNVYAQAPVNKHTCPDYIRNSRDLFINNHDYEDLGDHNRSTFETFSRRPAGCRDSLSSFRASNDHSFLSSTMDPNIDNSLLSTEYNGIATSPRDHSRSLSLQGEPFHCNTLGSFKGSPPPSPYRSLQMAANGPIPRGVPESPSTKSHSLFGDESPYNNRMIRDHLIDPESPYRIFSSEQRRTPSIDSPYKKTHRLDNDSPYRMTSDYGSMNRMSGKESPYRSPILNGDPTNSYRTTPEMHRAFNHTFPHIMDPQISLRSVPENPNFHTQLYCSTDEPSAFEPIGDFLYKRPPSPLSPPSSTKKSNDSLQRSPSGPKASPGMSGKQMNFHRTPPQKRRIKNPGVYEYD